MNTREYSQQYRAANLERLREYDRQRYRTGTRKAQKAAWASRPEVRERRREQYRARMAIPENRERRNAKLRLSPEQHAAKLAAITYTGRPCPRCGGTLRYISTRRCVPCGNGDNKTRRARGRVLTPAEMHANYLRRGQRTAQLHMGTQMPEGSRAAMGPNHHGARKFQLVSPNGTHYEFVNLNEFVRQHAELFEPADVAWFSYHPDTDPGSKHCKAESGLRRLFGKKAVRSWKGWRAPGDSAAPTAKDDDATALNAETA